MKADTIGNSIWLLHQCGAGSPISGLLLLKERNIALQYCVTLLGFTSHSYTPHIPEIKKELIFTVMYLQILKLL